MKILFADDQAGAMSYIYMGLCKALSACGHDVTIWNLKTHSPNDALDLNEPQLLIMQTYNLTRSCVNAILERPWLKVVLRSSDYGDFQKNIDLSKYPILIANDEEKKHVQKLVDNNSLNFIHAHYIEDRLKETHNLWNEMGCKVVSLLSGADIFDYTNGQKMRPFECDAVFVGGYWGYKAKTLEKYIVPLRDHINLKVFGNQPWGIPEYCGTLPDEYVKHAFSSAKVCPNVSEPHSQDFGYDIIERPYKLLSNGCFVVSDYVEDMPKVFGNGILYGKTPQDFREIIMSYLNNEEERNKIANIGKNIVLNNHTYFHRAAKLFHNLDMEQEADNCLMKYDNITEKLNIQYEKSNKDQQDNLKQGSIIS